MTRIATSQLRVFVSGASVYACTRPGGRSYRLGPKGSTSSGANKVRLGGSILTAGTYVAWDRDTTHTTAPAVVTHEVFVLDARTGRVRQAASQSPGEVADDVGGPIEFVLNAHGTVVWINHAAAGGRGGNDFVKKNVVSGATTVLDQSKAGDRCCYETTISDLALSASGSRAYWLNGTPNSASI